MRVTSTGLNSVELGETALALHEASTRVSEPHSTVFYDAAKAVGRAARRNNKIATWTDEADPVDPIFGGPLAKQLFDLAEEALKISEEADDDTLVMLLREAVQALTVAHIRVKSRDLDDRLDAAYADVDGAA